MDTRYDTRDVEEHAAIAAALGPLCGAPKHVCERRLVQFLELFVP